MYGVIFTCVVQKSCNMNTTDVLSYNVSHYSVNIHTVTLTTVSPNWVTASSGIVRQSCGT